MYMNGRGPMGGHGGPGFRPGMGFGPMHRPMRMRRRMGFFPLGALFILPGLMFGGWIAVAVLAGILGLAGSIIGGVFKGLGALAHGVFSGSGLALGVAIGIAAYYFFRNRKKEEAARQENTGTVDGVEVEQVIEPEKVYRTNY